MSEECKKYYLKHKFSETAARNGLKIRMYCARKIFELNLEKQALDYAKNNS